MFLLASPSIYPIVNVVLLLCHVVCTYYGMSPPTPPPPLQDQVRFTLPDYITKTTAVQRKLTALVKTVHCGIGIAEALAFANQLTSNSLPSIPDAAYSAITIGAIFGITGGLIRIWCHRTLGHLFTWQMSIREDHRLMTTGPYAFVRHPGYTGWNLNAIGNLIILSHCASTNSCASSLTGRMAAISMGVALYHMFTSYWLWTRMKKEDAMMRQHFGKQWEVWAQNTPYSMLPFIY